MAKCSLVLFVLMLGSLGGIYSAQITASNHQIFAAASEPSKIYVGFSDILPLSDREELEKKVFKRDIELDDDFSIDDESSLQNASAEASPLPAGNVVSQEDSKGNVSSVEDLTTDEGKAPTGNELDFGNDSNEGHASPTTENVIAVSGEVTEKVESVTTEKTDVSDAREDDAEELEDISSENMAVDILAGHDAVNSGALGKLMANDDGSGDGESDGESEEIKPFRNIVPTPPENSDNKTDETNTSDIATDETEATTTVDISIDEGSEESTDPPDEIPIPNPPPREEDSTAKDFKEEELIPVSTSAASSEEHSSTGVSEKANSLAEGNSEGSGEDSDESVSAVSDSEEIEETTTEQRTQQPTHVPAGRNFPPITAIDTTEPPPPTDAPKEADDTDINPLVKGVLPPSSVEREGINEIGVKEGVTPAEGAAEGAGEKPTSSSGSFIVLGAIMVTIVVLLVYTVIKSRRQKKARRSGNITKAAEEDQGREMKEVDKLLAPRTNGFSPPNGGAKDDERLPLKSFKGDFDELGPTKNGHLPEKDAGGLTDVIVENVPRLNPSPKVNGTAANENQGDDDQDSWVQGADKALESTKIKMYIDEDSIPKTPIVIVNRGSTTN